MHKTVSEARALAREIANGLRGVSGDVDVVLCPPFPLIPAVAETLKETSVAWGGQNSATRIEGPLTGEVSAAMLIDLGCRFVILGHSERRQSFGETDEAVHAKLGVAMGVGLTAIVCVGETLEERERGRTEEVVDRQVRRALEGFPGPQIARTVLAYEPVWAIGTGRNATPAQAEAIHRRIRVCLQSLFGEETATTTRILYGGSVKPDNAKDLFAQANIDGGLIGGASLVSKDFLEIVRAACSTE
jgi:triosephosphate isomerase